MYTLQDLKSGFRFKQLLRKLQADFPKYLSNLNTDQNPKFLIEEAL